MPNETQIGTETLTNEDFMPSQDFIDSFKNVAVEGADDEFQSDDSATDDVIVDNVKEVTETEKPNEEDVLNDQKFNEDFSKRFEGKYKSVDELKEHLSKQKSFETELEERSEGKYKSYDELKAELAKEKTEFANDKIKFLNELAKSGYEINDAYIAEINRDYESMKDNKQILAAGLKKANPDWTDKEIEFELKTKYRTGEWSEEGEEPTEVESIMRIKMERDSANTKAKLITDRDALKYIKPKDPVAEAKIAKDAQKWQEDFEARVDNEIVGKISKLSIPVSEKESFDYEVDATIKGEVAQMVKDMGGNMNAYWNQYKDSKGDWDLNKFSTDMIKVKSFDKAIRLSHETAFGKGRETEVKTIKNVNFEPNSQKTGGSVKQTMDDAMASALLKHL